MDVMDSSDESEDERISVDMLEDLFDGIKSHTSVNIIKACYKIRDCIKQRHLEWKGALSSTQNMGKVLHKKI